MANNRLIINILKLFLAIIIISLNLGTALSQSNQTVVNGISTTAINFPATGCTYNWVNDNPAIGLASSGSVNIPSFIPVNTGTVPIVATITATPVATEYAYIANVISNDVSVINLSTNTVIASIPVGGQPCGVSVSSDGTKVYVTNTISNTVSVINTSTNSVIATIPVGNYPYSMMVSKDGSKLYVANQSSTFVSIINTSTNTVSGTIPLNNYDATCIASNSDGSKLYITNWVKAEVYVVNTANNTVIATVQMPKPSYPWGLAVTPDDSKVYVGNNRDNSIYVINASNNSVSTIALNSSANPAILTISFDGKTLYVANNSSNNISVVNIATNTVSTNIAAGLQPLGLSFNKSGNLLYVANTVSSNVSVINTSTNTVTNSISVGRGPLAVGNFIASPTNCGPPVTFTITVNPPQPTITTTNLSSVNTVYGTASVPASFNVSGIYMSNNISITAPLDFEISRDAATYSNTISIGSAGTISPTTIYVRLLPTASVGNKTGDLIISSTGATTINQPINGIVTPAPIAITAPDVQKNYGSVLTDITSSSFLASGLKNAEIVSTVAIHYASGATANSTAGTYAGSVLASNPSGSNFNPSNYTITYTAGNITVVPAELKIIANDKYKVYGSANPPLTVSYSGFVNQETETQLIKLPVATTIAGTSSPIGQYIITASGAASSNYNITYIDGTLTIVAAPNKILIPNAFTPNGDGINDTWVIENIQDYSNCVVLVYNRYGQEVFTSHGYTRPWNGTKDGKPLPSGTYYYKIVLNNSQQPSAGYLVLFR